MKHIFEQAIANVRSAYPSVYTKEDVVILINDLLIAVEAVEKEKPTVSNDALERIKESLLEGVKNISIEDYVELELNYDNRIDINIDERAILNEVEESFDIAVDEVFPKLTPIAPVAGSTQTETNQ